MRKLSRWITTIAFILVVVISVLAVIDNRSGVALRFLGVVDAGNQHLLVDHQCVRTRRSGRLDERRRTGVARLSGNRRLRRDLDRSQTELARAKSDVTGV